ncbi:glycosyltransferase family 39 protein [Candidatus Gottesmanbacteria bacterium]|nr:glycosyltransferase family 39 protein [Candidatus Gottesmanbacteria bacterium]
MTRTPLLYWTQSLWRDEAYSIWIADASISEVIKRTSGDYNPPLYYLLLKFWMHLFGKNELALRGFSLIAFLLFLMVVYLFSKKLFKDPRWRMRTLLLFATNPMLLYFAFELRMYALLTLFTGLSMYFCFEKNWRWYIVVTALGMYTQPFMSFVVLTQTLYFIITKHRMVAIKNALIIFALYLPWMPTLIAQIRASGPMWINSVDLKLFLSVLGNLYVGYEGIPPGLWHGMYILSFLFLVLSVWLWRQKSLRSTSLLFLLWVYIPTAIVLLISLVKPIYVHRYLIYVTVGEVMLVSFALYHLASTWKYRLMIMILAAQILFTLYFAPYHIKIPIRDTFQTITPILDPYDMIYAASPLVYYESLYYAPQGIPVYLYNPEKITPPRFVGSIGMPPSTWRSDIPVFPNQAFMINEDGSYKILTAAR